MHAMWVLCLFACANMQSMFYDYSNIMKEPSLLGPVNLIASFPLLKAFLFTKENLLV